MGDIIRDITGLSFAEVCKACMTQDKQAKVTLILKGKRAQEHKAAEWIALGSSKNVKCTELRISPEGHYTVVAESR